MTTTVLTLPGISSQSCEPAIEGIVAAIAGVAAVEVDVPAKTATIIHRDDGAPAGRLVEAIEDQGYHVAGAKVIGESTDVAIEPSDLKSRI
ncbi:heavy-metal-associated domain-containing protein [Mycobacterium sp. SM1]|uniref:heavy-metal-associated domain-containing protein n=1 Tax=Mycobacterium sp. SM1 TaxID=2816243 RepID=UPI001BD12B35|nr:heavy-metal-associated domain-containing protein [Mycobacterium sp. SM1]MBS4727914.1 heavy-metal-associated domain-containing protein [Mycobacterium sp. SM1]